MKEKIVAFGGSGLVGSRFIELSRKYLEIDSLSSDVVDLLNFDQMKNYLNNSSADVVVNFAAYTNVEEAEKEKDDKGGLSYRLNVLAVDHLSKVCSETDKYLVHISTDYVFDGDKQESPYLEDDTPNPINWYGLTKYQGEVRYLENRCNGIIARIEMPYGQSSARVDFARFILEKLKMNQEVSTHTNWVTPVFLDDLVFALQELIRKRSKGIYHLASANKTTPHEFAIMMANKFGLDNSKIKTITFSEFSQSKKAHRPRFSWLDTSKFRNEFGEGILHTTDEALEIFKTQVDSTV